MDKAAHMKKSEMYTKFPSVNSNTSPLGRPYFDVATVLKRLIKTRVDVDGLNLVQEKEQ
jgi:hypothetical protein